MSSRAVPTENLDIAKPGLRVKAQRLLREGRATTHNNCVCVVIGDCTDHGVRRPYRVRRERVAGRWVYRCECDWAAGGYGQHIHGANAPCSHILAAVEAWEERKSSAPGGAAPNQAPRSAPNNPPAPGWWRNGAGHRVLVTGWNVVDDDPQRQADWDELEPQELESILRRRMGYRPEAELQAEEELAELERLLAS